MTGITAQSWLAVLIVLALVGVLAYLVRKGAWGALGRKGSSIQIETASPLGERRSLVIVAVEGRRLLLGLTPSQVTLVAELSVAELGPAQPFERHLDTQS
jgi:flagellar biosynthetic protein FliO